MKGIVHFALLRLLPLVVVALVVVSVARPAALDHAARDFAEEAVARAQARVDVDAPGPAASILFTDAAPDLGIDFVHDNAAHGDYFLAELMGPGGAFFDADGDGDLDIFVTGGGAVVPAGAGQPCRLYRNDGDRFTDVTEAWGAGVRGPANGVACADYDDDGDVDVFVSRVGPNALLRNTGETGTPRFEEVAEATGVADAGFGASAAFLDYDHDGHLDLYVTNYVDWRPSREVPCYASLGQREYCGPMTYEAPSVDRLYRNLGDGRFEDVSEATGISAGRGNGLGVLASDFDDDGWIDIYVANDETPAFLWHNNGDGTFADVAPYVGCAYAGDGNTIAGMGVACEDLEGDGDFDLFVANIGEQTHLVLENGGGVFEDISLRMGVGRWSMPVTGFGAVIFDQDHNGALDGFIANGAIAVGHSLGSATNPYAQPDQFIRLRDGVFVDASEGSGGSFHENGRGLTCGDYDGDGDLDLLVANNDGPLRLLRNENRSEGAWLAVAARLGPGRRHAIGARVTVTAGGRTVRREIRPQQSYLSSGDPRAHFGLGSAVRVERLEVLWPDGSRTVQSDLTPNRSITVYPGEVGG